MTSREQFLDVYEISRLDCDSDGSEDDRRSDDDIGLRGSEDEEDAVEEDLDDNIDSIYSVTALVTMESQKTQMMSIQKREKAQTRR